LSNIGQPFIPGWPIIREENDYFLEEIMKTTVGLWIDQRKAVIVFVTGRAEEINFINSNIPAEGKQQRELTEYLNIYYDDVISSLWNSGAILIMGPGEAKDELKKRLEINNLNGRIVEVETVDDKMTDSQIVAKAREHSLKHDSAPA
jgi:hypothetical protein